MVETQLGMPGVMEGILVRNALGVVVETIVVFDMRTDKNVCSVSPFQRGQNVFPYLAYFLIY